jgi:hypothetical protein
MHHVVTLWHLLVLCWVIRPYCLPHVTTLHAHTYMHHLPAAAGLAAQWFQVRTVHTSHPLHACGGDRERDMQCEWVSEWVSGPHVRMSVCVRDSSCAVVLVCHHHSSTTKSADLRVPYCAVNKEARVEIQCSVVVEANATNRGRSLSRWWGGPDCILLTPKPRPHTTPIGLKGQLGKRFFYKKRHQRPRTAETRCHRYTRKFD